MATTVATSTSTLTPATTPSTVSVMASTVVSTTLKVVTSTLKSAAKASSAGSTSTSNSGGGQHTTASSVKAATVATPSVSTSSQATSTPTSTSPLSNFLVGLDYIFYIWTFSLVSIVTYLSIYKYYQYVQTQKRIAARNAQLRHNQAMPLVAKNRLNEFVNFFRQLALYVQRFVNFFRTPKTGPYATSASASNSASTFSRFFFSSSTAGQMNLICLNNLLKWFYFNVDTTNKINSTILNVLNFYYSGNNQRPASVGHCLFCP